MTDDANTVRTALERAALLLSDAEADQAAGRAYTLAEFNELLTATCQAAVRLPKDHFKDVRGRMKNLLERLEVLKRECQTSAPPASPT